MVGIPDRDCNIRLTPMGTLVVRLGVIKVDKMNRRGLKPHQFMGNKVRIRIRLLLTAGGCAGSTGFAKGRLRTSIGACRTLAPLCHLAT